MLAVYNLDEYLQAVAYGFVEFRAKYLTLYYALLVLAEDLFIGHVNLVRVHSLGQLSSLVLIGRQLVIGCFLLRHYFTTVVIDLELLVLIECRLALDTVLMLTI